MANTKRKSAFFAVMDERREHPLDEQLTPSEQKQETANDELPSEHIPVVSPIEVTLPKTKTAKKKRIHEKTTTYFSRDQREKLEDLAHKYKKRRGKRISWHDVLRYLIDTCSSEQILNADIKTSNE